MENKKRADFDLELFKKARKLDVNVIGGLIVGNLSPADS